jgi:hypothetical protein
VGGYDRWKEELKKGGREEREERKHGSGIERGRKIGEVAARKTKERWNEGRKEGIQEGMKEGRKERRKEETRQKMNEKKGIHIYIYIYIYT